MMIISEGGEWEEEKEFWLALNDTEDASLFILFSIQER